MSVRHWFSVDRMCSYPVGCLEDKLLCVSKLNREPYWVLLTYHILIRSELNFPLWIKDWNIFGMIDIITFFFLPSVLSFAKLHALAMREFHFDAASDNLIVQPELHFSRHILKPAVDPTHLITLVLFLSSRCLWHIEPANFPCSLREGHWARPNLASETEPRFPLLLFRLVLDVSAFPKQIRQCEGQSHSSIQARLLLVKERQGNKL